MCRSSVSSTSLSRLHWMFLSSSVDYRCKASTASATSQETNGCGLGRVSTPGVALGAFWQRIAVYDMLDWFIDFSTRSLITIFNQDQNLFWRWWYLCQFRTVKLVAQTLLLHWFNGGSDDTAFCCFFWRSGLLECWWAIGLAVLSCLGRPYTRSGHWIHLPFRYELKVIDPTD